MSISTKCECLQGTRKTLIKCFRGTAVPPLRQNIPTHFCGAEFFCVWDRWNSMSISTKCECLQGTRKTLIKCFRGTAVPPLRQNIPTHFCGAEFFCVWDRWNSMSISTKCECLQGTRETLIKCFRGTAVPPLRQKRMIRTLRVKKGSYYSF